MVLLLLFLAFALNAEKKSDDSIWSLGGQSTWIFQQSTGTSGKHFNPDLSFGPDPSFGWSGTVSIFAGVSPWKGSFFKVEPEYANGHGMPNASGMAGYPNGEIIRTGVIGSNPPPYIARAFYQQKLDAFTMAIGKFAANDFFDVSRIASNPRVHFLNWALMEQGAWDYAADVRGYTYGAIIAYEPSIFSICAGLALMPKIANGVDLNWNILQSQSGMLEVELRYQILEQPGLFKILGYLNHANMGNYDQAIRSAPIGSVPDIIATRSQSALKYGGGILVEQQLNSEIAGFLRAGLNDGQTESFAFTEIDHSLSFGAHMTGAYWKRPLDRLALAFVTSGLSDSHANYLKAGGLGFQLGDGALDYAWETILETYYRVSFGEHVEISADAQAIWNPGMNAGHSPTVVFGLRLHGH